MVLAASVNAEPIPYGMVMTPAARSAPARQLGPSATGETFRPVTGEFGLWAFAR